MKTGTWMVGTCLGIALVAPIAWAAGEHGAASPQMAAPATSSAGAMADGEIRKVDKDAEKITIKHGEIRNLDMPPMTMVVRVKDRALLDQVKPGDKVRFSAENIQGAMTVTAIEPAMK